MSEKVPIRVSRETRQALKDIGWKGETYDVVIRRLLRINTVLSEILPMGLEDQVREKAAEAEA